MTAEEIKKAWNTFKRELKKELSEAERIGFYMNTKQIANNTATINLGWYGWTYEEHISYYEESIIKVNGYESWTAEEKAKNEAYCKERIEYNKGLLEKYGTVENEAKTIYAGIISSKAYKKFASNFSSMDTCIEDTNETYYCRFSYQA